MIILKDKDFNDKSLYLKDINFGGKAKGLINLKNNGLLVPSFCVAYDIKGDETLKEVENLIYREVRRGALDPDLRYSVRSSASLEDGKKHSFAGIFDSFLNVPIEDIGQKILECVKSMQSKRVETYMLENHIPSDELRMNVIIQEMIYAEKSGVLFTYNPKGIVSESVIVMGEGSGDNVVLGRVPTSTVYYSNLEDVFYLEKQEGGPDIKKEHIRELRENGRLMEDKEGYPCDIEFSIKDDRIYYLQLRPVTRVKKDYTVTLDNSNLVESYPGICLPLTDSFVREAYGGVFTGLITAMVKNPHEVEPFKERLNSMVTSSSGRMYYKINNWYYFLSFLPFNKRVIKIWQDNMGIRNRSYEDIKKETSIVTRFKAKYNFIKALIKNKENLEGLNKEFEKMQDYYESEILKVKTNEEIKALYNELKDKVMSKWYLTLINDMHTFIFTSLSSIGGKDKKLKNIRDVKSLEPLKELISIAHDMPHNIHIKTSKEADEFLSQENELSWRINSFINEYGDRVTEELKLETKTYRTNAELVFKRLKELKEANVSLDNINDGPELKGGFFWKKAALGIRFREESRLNRTKLFGMVREMFLLMAYNLKKEGFLDSLDDVFYLTKEELFLEKVGHDEFKRIVKERKRKYEIFKKLPTYNRIEFSGEEFDRILTDARDFSMDREEIRFINGEGASEGKVTGLVRLIKDPNDVEGELSGRIIVTSFTDPGWIYLISQSAGLIVEMGSILSHSAIITRELCKPSVVGVKNAMKLLRDGDLVEIDGNQGTIEILERKP